MSTQEDKIAVKLYGELESKFDAATRHLEVTNGREVYFANAPEGYTEELHAKVTEYNNIFVRTAFSAAADRLSASIDYMREVMSSDVTGGLQATFAIELGETQKFGGSVFTSYDEETGFSVDIAGYEETELDVDFSAIADKMSNDMSFLAAASTEEYQDAA